MIAIEYEPPIPNKKIDELFTQRIVLRDNGRLLARAVWTSTAPSQGVVQILEFWIDSKSRRTGLGRQLLRSLTEQTCALGKMKAEKMRRLWIAVGHKTQVVGRAFLTSQGFHHVGTTSGLMDGEDLLVYVKSLD